MGTDNGACWHGFSQERGPRTPGPGPPDAAAGRDPGRWRPPARRGHLAPARDPGVTCSRTSPRGGHRALGSSGGRDSPSGAGRRLRAQACSPGEAPAAGSVEAGSFLWLAGPPRAGGAVPPAVPASGAPLTLCRALPLHRASDKGTADGRGSRRESSC